jgi:hypothetical protein
LTRPIQPRRYLIRMKFLALLVSDCRSQSDVSLRFDTRRFAESGLETLGDLEYHAVGEARTEDRDSERHPVLGEARRARDARQIKNVGEVCKLAGIVTSVGQASKKGKKGTSLPQPVVETDWVCKVFRFRRMHRGRRDDQDIHLPVLDLGKPLAGHHLEKIGPGVHGGKVLGCCIVDGSSLRQQDVFGTRIRRGWVCIIPLLDTRDTLGDEAALVQQLSGVLKDGIVNAVDQLATDRFNEKHGFFEEAIEFIGKVWTGF